MYLKNYGEILMKNRKIMGKYHMSDIKCMGSKGLSDIKKIVLFTGLEYGIKIWDHENPYPIFWQSFSDENHQPAGLIGPSFS